MSLLASCTVEKKANMVKSVLFFSGLVSVGFAGLLRDGSGRQFLPSDITGEYSHFVKQGTCAKQVNLTSYAPISAGAYSIPHSQISEDGTFCTSNGVFTIVTKEALVKSGNQLILDNAPKPLATVVNALESQKATYMLGFETVDRLCGSSSSSANSIAVFVEKEEKIEIPGLITLYPGAKYMIVYEPTSPTPCTYFSKYADTVIGIPNEDGTVPENPDDIPSATAVVDPPGSGAKDVEPSADAEVVDKEPVAINTSSSPEPSTAPANGSGGIDPIPVPGGSSGSGSGSVSASPTTSSSSSTTSDGTAGSSSGPVVVGEEGGFGIGTDEPEPSPSEEEDGESVCFPASATVELENGSLKYMDEIELGDHIKVASGEFSPVFMFSHKNAEVDYSFVIVTTVSGESLRLTKGHYLYVNCQLVAAKAIRAGDALTTENGLTTVATVSTTVDTGLYNPQTVHGDIIVNGIVTSTYTTTVEVKTAHSLLVPIRALFSWTGMATSLFNNGADRLAEIVPSGGLVA